MPPPPLKILYRYLKYLKTMKLNLLRDCQHSDQLNLYLHRLLSYDRGPGESVQSSLKPVPHMLLFYYDMMIIAESQEKCC